MELKDSILLMGPMKVGKTTMAAYLIHHYNFNYIDCDALFDSFFLMSGYRYNYFDDLLEEKGLDECLKEVENINIKFVKHIFNMLNDFNKMTIVDFGAIHTYFNNQGYIDELAPIFNKYKNAILILPYKTSEFELLNFDYMNLSKIRIEINNRICKSVSNKIFSNKIFYSMGKTEEELYKEINYYLKQNFLLEKESAPSLEEADRLIKIRKRYFKNA